MACELEVYRGIIQNLLLLRPPALALHCRSDPLYAGLPRHESECLILQYTWPRNVGRFDLHAGQKTKQAFRASNCISTTKSSSNEKLSAFSTLSVLLSLQKGRKVFSMSSVRTCIMLCDHMVNRSSFSDRAHSRSIQE